MNPTIITSGVGVPNNAIAFPSGQIGNNTPGGNLNALLVSANSSFGFNLQPNTLSTEWVPKGEACDFHGASGQLPLVGQNLEIDIGSFSFKGNVTHSDYTSSSNGTIVKITMEDNRKTLRKIKIHTEDLGEDLPSGVVSIARAYRKVNGLTLADGNPSDPLIQEYERILRFGASFDQILSAIDFHFNEGRIATPITELPSPLQIAQNIGGDINSIRWQFNLSLLDEAITRILQDFGFDWYWSMESNKIALINKRIPFDPDESRLIDLMSTFGSASGLNETRQVGFGQDVVPDPTRFRVLGGHQQGFINSEILSPIDGMDTSSIDGSVSFLPIWDRISIGFYDSGGFYRTYIPCEKELQFALAGIEQWAYFKIYQTTPSTDDPPGFNLALDVGVTAAQDLTFQSRIDPVSTLLGGGTGSPLSGIRAISNRRDAENNWVIAWYNRVRNHSSRHYGRSYIAEGILFNEASGLFRLIDSAWANVENQVEGFELSPSGTVGSGIFVENYEINRSLGPISPFVTNDLRVRGHCVLPKDTVYGPQGDGVPASFGNWTEDARPFNPSGDGRHYLPVDLLIVGQKVINPRSDQLYGFESFPEGTLLCQLPVNAGPSSGLLQDGIISSLATLLTTQNKLTSSGLQDIIDPSIVLNAYELLSGVAIPVESRSRYGQSFPTTWVAGTPHYQRDEDVQLDDQFVPWAFSPRGSSTSLDVMSERAYRRAVGKIVPRSSSRYADFNQVGLPLLTFDGFANQAIGPSGQYGEIVHGVSEVNITFGIDGFLTRYKIQSYFPRFGKDAPLGERVRAQLNGIINPVDFTDLELLNQNPGQPEVNFLPGDELPIPFFFDEEKRAVRVTITQVNNAFELDDNIAELEEERYRGLDQQLYEKPPTLSSPDKDFTDGGICIDGFLNVGDEALYHVDNFDIPGGNTIFRYFTQGRPFGNGTIVQIERVNPDDASKFDVTIVDPTALLNNVTRALIGIAPLNGSAGIGEKTTLAVQGDAPVRPGFTNSDSIFVNPTVTAGAGVSPVEVIDVSGIGTPEAIAVCKPLDSNGVLVSSGITFGDCVILPYPQFAASGDRGFLTNASVQNVTTVSNVSINFVHINRPAFLRYRD